MGAQHSLRLPFGKPRLPFGKPRGADGGERGGGGGGRVKAAGGGVYRCESEVYSAFGGSYGSKSVMVLPYHYGARAVPVGEPTNIGNRGGCCANFISCSCNSCLNNPVYKCKFTLVNA